LNPEFIFYRHTIIGTTVVGIGRPFKSELRPASLFAGRIGAFGV
jgi:hypothetical protein